MSEPTEPRPGAKSVFAALARVGVDRPRRILFLALALFAILGGYTAGIGINTSRHTMVAADNPHQAKQVAYFDTFGVPTAMVLVVSGAEASDRRAVVDSLERELSTLEALNDRLLGRVRPETMAELVFLNDPTLVQKLPQLLNAPSDSLGALVSAAPSRPGFDDQGYLASSDGDHHFVVLLPEIEGDQAADVEPIVLAIREVRDRVLADKEITARLTGPPALMVDEQGEIQRGILQTSAATGLGILLLLYFAFRNVRHTLLALLPVVLGTVATMAVARLFYGELNMVTSSCSSILLALGIDFGVLLLSRFGEIARTGASVRDAVIEASHKAGLALFVGALTTAVAFLTTSATEFTAYARLGVIVSVGLVIMMASTLVMMPALLWVTGRGRDIVSPELPGLRRLVPVIRRGRWALVVLALGLGAGALAMAPQLEFNTRFYDFIPERGESASALLVLEDDANLSPLHATVPVPNLAEARELAERLRELPIVAAVQSPTDLFAPLTAEAKTAFATLAKMPPPDLKDAPAWLGRAWKTAVTVGEHGRVAPEDLPAFFRAQYVGRDQQSVSLTVLPAGNIWDPDTARAFADAVSEVAPNATGLAMHVSAHLDMIANGFTKAAGAAAGLVLLILLVAFRRISDAVFAMVPTLVGFSWMLGAMFLLDFDFDAANIVTLPLIIGIGVDAGVHLTHRLRQSAEENGGIAKLDDIVAGTGGGVALASLTTAVGFASLMIAEYGAMRSLGLAMTLGILSTLVASIVVLPSLMVGLGRAK